MTHRLERILKLLSLLQGGTPLNALQLAQATGVHRRTIFRDIALLRNSGIPIHCDEQNSCYSLVGGGGALHSALTAADLHRCLQLACLGNMLLRGNMSTISRTVKSLAAALPPDDREAVEQLLQQSRLAVDPEKRTLRWDDSHPRPEVVATITRAIRQQQTLVVLVHDGTPELQSVQLDHPRLLYAPRGMTLEGEQPPEGHKIELAIGTIRDAATVTSESESDPDFHLGLQSAPPTNSPAQP